MNMNELLEVIKKESEQFTERLEKNKNLLLLKNEEIGIQIRNLKMRKASI